MDKATTHAYLLLLLAAVDVAYDEMEKLTDTITEETLNENFDEYLRLHNHLNSLLREIKRTKKELGLRRKQFNHILLNHQS